MRREDPFEVARAIAALDAWGRIKPYQWAAIPNMADEARICLALKAPEDKTARDPVVGRILVFDGYGKFHLFAMREQRHDFGVASRIAELDHIAVEAHRSGAVAILKMKPGYVPQTSLPPAEAKALAAILYECYGLMLRCEENPELHAPHLSEKTIFARWQNADGSWRDGSYRIPLKVIEKYVEHIALLKSDILKARNLPMHPQERWICNFSLCDSMYTREEPPRFAYFFAAMDERTDSLRMLDRMSVGETLKEVPVSDPGDGLKSLWEQLSARMVKHFLTLGFVPGEIVVPSRRHLRFLRVLTTQFAFKLTVRGDGAAFERLMALSLETFEKRI